MGPERSRRRGTDVRYSAAAEMDTGLPGFLERPFKDKARSFFVDAPVEALKKRAEAQAGGGHSS